MNEFAFALNIFSVSTLIVSFMFFYSARMAAREASIDRQRAARHEQSTANITKHNEAHEARVRELWDKIKASYTETLRLHGVQNVPSLFDAFGHDKDKLS